MLHYLAPVTRCTHSDGERSVDFAYSTSHWHHEPSRLGAAPSPLQAGFRVERLRILSHDEEGELEFV